MKLTEEDRTQIVQEWLDTLRSEELKPHFNMASWIDHVGPHRLRVRDSRKAVLDCGTSVCGYGTLLLAHPSRFKIRLNQGYPSIRLSAEFAKSLGIPYVEDMRPAWVATKLCYDEAYITEVGIGRDVTDLYERLDQLFLDMSIRSPKVFARRLAALYRKHGMKVQ